MALAGSVDGLLVVAHAGRVTEPNVVETLERLERIGAPILGLVLNQASQVSKGYYAYGGYGPPPAAIESQLRPEERPDTDDSEATRQPTAGAAGSPSALP